LIDVYFNNDLYKCAKVKQKMIKLCKILISRFAAKTNYSVYWDKNYIRFCI